RMPGRTMLQYALAAFKTQVQAIEFGIALLEFVNDPEALQIMLEPTRGGRKLAHAGIELVLASVSERCMAQIMRQRDGFDKVFVQAQVARQRTGNLCHLYAVRQPCAEQITFVIDENLGLVLKQPEGIAVDDAIASVLECDAPDRRHLEIPAPPRALRVAGKGRELSQRLPLHPRRSSGFFQYLLQGLSRHTLAQS